LQALPNCKNLGDNFAIIIKDFEESENNDLFIKSKLFKQFYI
jgi:hypothetical protein